MFRDLLKLLRSPLLSAALVLLGHKVFQVARQALQVTQAIQDL